MNVTYRIDKDILYIAVEGRIDASNAALAEEKIFAVKNENPGKHTVVDAEKLRALIDDIRLNIPGEIKQARGIVADRTDIITNAKREADGIIRNAEDIEKLCWVILLAQSF